MVVLWLYAGCRAQLPRSCAWQQARILPSCLLRGHEGLRLLLDPGSGPHCKQN
jgi:hypothetical protein